MGENIVYKILKKHIVEGVLEVGKPIGLRIVSNLNSRFNRNYGISSIRSYGNR